MLKSLLQWTALVFVTSEVVMLMCSGAAALGPTKLTGENTYRCESGVLLQKNSLSQEDLVWWGVFPLYQTTRDETVVAWLPTDKKCVA